MDELGNEYEATYPKRAKGLVKNGRARFVDENKICLACPPDKHMEEPNMADKKQKEITEPAKAVAQTPKEFTDAYEAELSKLTNDKGTVRPTDETHNEIVESAKAAARSAKEFTDAYEAEMSELTNDKGTGQLTARELFTQLTVLQKQLTESSGASLYHVSDAITAIVEGTEDGNSEIAEKITNICYVFKAREETLRKLLDVYEKMYDDVQGAHDKSVKIKQATDAFDPLLAFINDSDLKPEDKYASVGYVTDKIAELTERILFDPTERLLFDPKQPKEKQNPEA